MKIRASYWADIVAACRQHLLRWGIRGGAYDLSNEVHLSHGYHVADTRDVVEHPLHMFISDVFFFDPCDRDMEDTSDAVMIFFFFFFFFFI